MHALLQDFRYGVRQLLRQRGSSIVAVLTFALGIGASTAVFSVVDSTMLRPLPYPDREQLVSVTVAITEPDGRVFEPTASMADMRLWQQADDVFSKVAGWGGAALITPVIKSFLFETAPTDTLTFVAVPLTLLAAGCLVALVPAIRAARVDPVATLRAE